MTLLDPALAESYVRSLWAEQVRLADRFDDPGNFTALIGFEGSAAPQRNLHRNVIDRDGADKAGRKLPFSAPDSLDPVELWKFMAACERDGFDGGDIVLQAAGSLTNTNRRLPVTTFDGVYVSFLELDFDDDLGAGLFFRVESGGTVLIDRAFEDSTVAREFFSGVLDLGALTNGQRLSTIDLRFTLGLSNASNGGRAATYLLVGTTIVPEPGTATLIGFGLLVLAVRRSRR
jgi:hypothetical protein